MTIERNITVPANHKATIEMPKSMPPGTEVSVKFIWPPENDRTEQKSGASILNYLGLISCDTFGNGVVYQRRLRDEWNE